MLSFSFKHKTRLFLVWVLWSSPVFFAIKKESKNKTRHGTSPQTKQCRKTPQNAPASVSAVVFTNRVPIFYLGGGGGLRKCTSVLKHYKNSGFSENRKNPK